MNRIFIVISFVFLLLPSVVLPSSNKDQSFDKDQSSAELQNTDQNNPGEKPSDDLTAVQNDPASIIETRRGEIEKAKEEKKEQEPKKTEGGIIRGTLKDERVWNIFRLYG